MTAAIERDGLAADVEAFLRHVLHERALAANTALTYERGLSRYAAFVGTGGVADYLIPQPGELAGFLEWLHHQGLAPATRAATVTALRMFYERLVALGRTPKASARPVAALGRPNLPERLPRLLTVEQVRKLLQAPNRRHRMYWLYTSLMQFLAATGCRASEAAGLRLADLNLDEATALVLGKGGKSRHVVMGEPCLQALQAYLALLRPESALFAKEPPAWVFLSKTGRRLDRSFIWTIVNGHAVKAGLPAWVGPHSLRHFTASRMLMGGSDLRYVQELAGHASPATTTIYLHLDASHLRRAHDRLEQYRRQDEPARPRGPEAVASRAPDNMPPLRLPKWTRHDRRLRWSAREDALVRSLPPEEAARLTGRSKVAIYNRRCRLGVSGEPGAHLRGDRREKSPGSRDGRSKPCV